MAATLRLPRGLRLARSGDAELLDGPLLDREELAANLRELAMLNRLPGGTAASIEAIEHVANGARDLSILDLGTGGGDMPSAFARHGRRRGRWRIVATDLRPEIVELARARVRDEADVTVELADATRLPFPNAAFDVAHASLLLHHLEPHAAISMLSEMRRVARLGVVINDLQRGVLHLAITATTVLALARSRYTRHDGLLSARRAYTLVERGRLLAAAELRVDWQSNRLAPRVVSAAIPLDGR